MSLKIMTYMVVGLSFAVYIAIASGIESQNHR